MQGNYFRNKMAANLCLHTLLENARYKQHVSIQADQLASNWACTTFTEKLFLASLAELLLG